MKRKMTSILTISLLVISLMFLPKLAFASNTVTISPSSAYVGMFRSIIINAYATDNAYGVVTCGFFARNVPQGIWIDFIPSQVYTGTINSSMLIYAGPAASPGIYSITVVAAWTAIDGAHWETPTAFPLTVKGVSPASMSENPWETDWAHNPNLILQNPPKSTVADKWYPGVRIWDFATGANWAVSNTPNLYANWNQSGLATLYSSCLNMGTQDQVSHLIQGLPEGKYQPSVVTPVTLNPFFTQVNLKANITSAATTHPNTLVSWTGMKFDVYAVDTKDGRVLYMELYFNRTGGNTPTGWQLLGGKPGTWVSADGNEVVEMGANVDDYLVDINAPAEPFNQAYSNIIPNGNGGGLFSVDLSGFFGEAAYRCQQYNAGNHWNGRSISDYNITQVAVCIESLRGWTDLGPIPTCWLKVSQFEVKGSYIPDINLDGKVNLQDLVLFAKSYNQPITSPAYLPNADFNLDGKVGLAENVILAKFYNKQTFP